MIPGKVAVLLQARLDSQRLPGKVLALAAGATVLEHCLRRLQSATVGPVVVATTMLPADDAIDAEARRLNVPVYRGSEHDVLSRLVAAATAVGAEFVIRATADNPAVDPGSAVRLIEALRAAHADHAVEDGLAYGCTVEAVTASALRDAAARTTDPSEREHVTPYVRRGGSGFKCLVLPAPAVLHRPDLRFSVDTAADLAYMREVLGNGGAAGARVVPLEDLIAAADRLAARREVA